MTSASWMDRIRYRFDNYMSRGTAALIGGLGLLSLIIILLSALVLVLTGVGPDDAGPMSFGEAAWSALMRTLDAGTMGGDAGWRFRLIMFVVTLGGVFVISALIGVLTSGLESKLEELRKGRSRVMESGHTVLLGWSPKVFSILSELVIANANLPSACVVVLGDKDKIEMEDEIRAAVGRTGRTRIVCRTGSPINLSDLEIVNLQAARSIVVLSPEGDNPDSEVIKTILAITNNPQRRAEPYNIVAEVRDPKNLDVARMVGKDEVEIVLVGNLISRIIAQTCRQSGLSVVYTELLDFGGDEIYFKEEPALVGRTYAQSLQMYADSALIGVQKAGGIPQLNPPMDTRIEPGDRILAISEDDDTIRLSSGPLEIQADAIFTRSPQPPHPERTLVLGWNWRAPSILSELDHYVADGSHLTVVANLPVSELEAACSGQTLEHEQVTFIEGDTTDRRLLNSLNVPQFDAIIVLSYSDALAVQEADAATLVTLLHLRDIADKGGHDFQIVSEMLDLRNRELAEVTRADDFIVSEKLISLMLSQVSENKALNAVFADIFDPDGSEIYLKPVEDYVQTGQPVNFYTLVEAAQRRGETAFGYRLKASSKDASAAYGVVVNPDKAQPIHFHPGDKLIVLAEE